MYLECSPNEDVVKKDRYEVARKIDILTSRFDSWRKANPLISSKYTETRLKQVYNQEFGLPTLKFQLKNLNYLLKQ